MRDGVVRARVKRQRKVNVFAELSQANWVLLENAKQKREGWFYECLSCVVMSAFRFEAFLNHVGSAVFPYWCEMECLANKSKLTIIRTHLGIVAHDGKRPYQTLKDIFKLRDSVAHGKPEVLDPPESIEKGYVEELRRKKPLARWEQLCTLEFAMRAYEDTEAIAREIGAKAGMAGSEFTRSGNSYSLKDVAEIGSHGGRRSSIA